MTSLVRSLGSSSTTATGKETVSTADRVVVAFP